MYRLKSKMRSLRADKNVGPKWAKAPAKDAATKAGGESTTRNELPQYTLSLPDDDFAHGWTLPIHIPPQLHEPQSSPPASYDTQDVPLAAGSIGHTLGAPSLSLTEENLAALQAEYGSPDTMVLPEWKPPSEKVPPSSEGNPYVTSPSTKEHHAEGIESLRSSDISIGYSSLSLAISSLGSIDLVSAAKAEQPSEDLNPSLLMKDTGTFDYSNLRSWPLIAGPGEMLLDITPAMKSQDKSQTRKILTHEERQRLCQYHTEHPSVKQTEIGAMFGVERSTVSRILRQKEKYLPTNPSVNATQRNDPFTFRGPLLRPQRGDSGVSIPAAAPDPPDCFPPLARAFSRPASVGSVVSSVESIRSGVISYVGSFFPSPAAELKADEWAPSPTEDSTIETQKSRPHRRRISHNMVERRRRDIINQNIQELSKLVPFHRLMDSQRRRGIDVTTDEAKDPTKADILSGAVTWIQDLMWLLRIKSQQQEELTTLITDLGGTYPFLHTTSEACMFYEFSQAMGQNEANVFEYSRPPGSGLYVPQVAIPEAPLTPSDKLISSMESSRKQKIEAFPEHEARCNDKGASIISPRYELDVKGGPALAEQDTRKLFITSLVPKIAAIAHENGDEHETRTGLSTRPYLFPRMDVPGNWFVIAGMTDFFGICLHWQVQTLNLQEQVICTSLSLRSESTLKRFLQGTQRFWELILMNLLRLREKPIPFEQKRIRWRCRCGHTLYDDFTELKPGALANLQTRLNHMYADNSNGSGGASNSRLVASIFGYLQSFFSGEQKSTQNQNFKLPHFTVQNAPSGSNQSAPNTPKAISDLHLCIEHGRYANKFHRLDVSAIQSDKELFLKLKANRNALHGRWRNFYSLRTLQTIKFVQFVLHKLDLVDVRPASAAPPIPPHDKLAEYKYAYNPIPPEHVPPIGENHLMHLYHHPECAHDARALLLSLFPKKVLERLVVCPQRGMSTGWGVHFVEGWNWDRIWVVSLLLFGLGSLAFALAWWALEHDVQGAFGVATYVTSFLALGVGMAQVKMQPGR